MCKRPSAKIQKQRTDDVVNARASWGAGVLRPYTDDIDGEYEVMG
jgi:hypothetical protein